MLVIQQSSLLPAITCCGNRNEHRQFSTSSSIKVQGHAQLVASLIEGLPLNEGRQGQLHAITQILTVAKPNLAAIAHLCLEGKE